MIKSIIVGILIFFMLIPTSAQHLNIDSLLNVASKTNSDSIKVHVYLKLALAYIYMTTPPDLDRSSEFADKALLLAENHKWKWAIYKCYRVRSIWGTLRGDHTNALHYDKMALQLAKTYDTAKMTLTYIDLSDDYIGLGNYSMAYFYALKSFETAQDTLDIIISKFNIAIIYKETEQYDKAVNQLLNTMEISRKLGDNEGVAYCAIELGNIFTLTNDTVRSKKFLDVALEIHKKYEFPIIKPQILFYYGQLYAKMGRHDAAIEYFINAIAAFRANSNIFDEILVMSYMGDEYIRMHKYAKAGEILNTAYTMADRANAAKIKTRVLQALIKLHSLISNDRQLAKFTELYEQHIQSTNNNNLILEMQTLDEEIKAASLILKSTKNKTVVAQRNNEEKTMEVIMYAIFAVMLILVAVAIKFRNRFT